MQNKRRLPTHITLKMYQRNAIPDEMLATIRPLWKELVAYEVGLVLQEKTLEALHKLAKERASDDVFMNSNWLSCVNSIDWLYVLMQYGTAVGFMVVEGGAVNSLYIKEDLRGRGIGTFLLHNHLEIFNTPLKLKVSKINTPAVNVYRGAGFITTDEDQVYYTMQYQFVKPVERLVELLST